VIDPRRSETAAMADIHLQVRPAPTRGCLPRSSWRIVEEGLVDRRVHRRAHAAGPRAAVRGGSARHPGRRVRARAGIDEALLRRARDAIAGAESLASFEDLGVQMNRHSTLVSYLHRLVWLLTGNFGRPGTHYIPTRSRLVNGEAEAHEPGGRRAAHRRAGAVQRDRRRDPDRSPGRYRAMLVEAANPAHSLADSPRMREALAALDTLVVIDVAMTETARLAHYVLPAATQFEKAEATFFNFEFPHNVFHLRRRLLPPPGTCCPRPRSTRAWSRRSARCRGRPRAAAGRGRGWAGAAYLQAFATRVMSDPRLSAQAPILLYRTLDLPDDAREGAVMLGLALRCGDDRRPALARAGFAGPPLAAASALFDAIVASPSGVVFAGRRVGRAARALHGPRSPAPSGAARSARGLGDPDPPRASAIPTSRSCCRPASAAVVHRQHDHPRSGLAQEGRRWRAAPPPRRRRGTWAWSPAAPRAGGDPAGREWSWPGRSPTPCSAATSRCPTAWASTTRRPRRGRADRRGPQRADRHRGDRDPFVGTPWHKHVAARLERV
jgi:hypothetical protein